MVPVEDLGPIFRQAARMYKENMGDFERYAGLGELIGTLFQDSWNTFSERIQQADLVQDLCVTILQAGLTKDDLPDEPDYNGLFFSEHPLDMSAEQQWEHRVVDLFRPVEKLTVEDFAAAPEGFFVEDAFDTLQFMISEMGTAYGTDAVFFRARIHEDRERRHRFERVELGAPPPDKARAGRANEQGQAVLYVASDAATAVAEVRPWKGAPVAVAKLRVTKSAKVLDLTAMEALESPFFDDEIAWKLNARSLLGHLGDELARPVTPSDAERQYRPTQYACSMIREAGFDGVAFPSAMGSGHNVVLFAPDGAEVLEIDYVRVSGLTYTFDAESAAEIDVDDFSY